MLRATELLEEGELGAWLLSTRGPGTSAVSKEALRMSLMFSEDTEPHGAATAPHQALLLWMATKPSPIQASTC